MRRLLLVLLLALALSVPAAAQPGSRGPVPQPTLPGRACSTAAGVCWAHPSAAPGTPCRCFTGAVWVAGVIREWVWDAPPSR